ncbi:MAG: sulfotransferase [Actinobacteria bacterium]|nr:sulfotransferase [Actinomycetota bacterium]
MTTARFVVGTGRCGSTLLSRMLDEHRHVVSIHEFFTGLDWNTRFAEGDVTGDGFAQLLAYEQVVNSHLLRLGYRAPEIVYPFDRPGVRWQPGDPMPWLANSMLPRLSDDPDALYDRMLAWAHDAPPRPLTEHYPALFGWLAEQAGGSVWVERSGASIEYLGELARVFPGARFVHLHRDGLEAALSMRAHPFFRTGMALMFQQVPAEVADTGDVGAILTYAAEHVPSYATAGRYWSDQVLRGYAALPAIDADRWLDVRFEDLLGSPERELELIATFLELPPDDGFALRAAALLDAPPELRAPGLSDGDRTELATACRPGQILLGRAT